MNNNIVIIGFMGVGKTSVSKALAQVMDMNLVVLDEIITKKEEMSINNIFNEYGEEYFRDSETNSLQGLIGRNEIVISGGGGIVLRDINITSMKEIGKIVLLTASVETIYNRVKDGVDRPILNNKMTIGFITSLIEKRKKSYLKAADIIVDTDNKSVEEVCKEIIAKLNIINI